MPDFSEKIEKEVAILSLNFATLRCGILTVTLRARFRCLSRSKEAPVEFLRAKVVLSGRMERLAQRNKIKPRLLLLFVFLSNRLFLRSGVCLVLQIRIRLFCHRIDGII